MRLRWSTQKYWGCESIVVAGLMSKGETYQPCLEHALDSDATDAKLY